MRAMAQAMAVLCAWIGGVLTRLSVTVEKLSASEIILAFDDESALATALALTLKLPLVSVQRHSFPDG